MTINIDIKELWSSPAHWVISAPIAIAEDAEAYLRSLLVSEEIKQAERFRKQTDYHRYILSHGLKRYCLASFLKVKPLDLMFTVGEKGKPFCEYPEAPDFNISHGGSSVLFGLSSLGSVGVDIEEASRQLSASVASYSLKLDQLGEVEKDHDSAKRLLLYWTQKEAISKALGLGLSIGFDTIDCNGKSGLSYSDVLGHNFLIESYVDRGHIISVASSESERFTHYELNNWNAGLLTLTEYFMSD